MCYKIIIRQRGLWRPRCHLFWNNEVFEDLVVGCSTSMSDVSVVIASLSDAGPRGKKSGKQAAAQAWSTEHCVFNTNASNKFRSSSVLLLINRGVHFRSGAEHLRQVLFRSWRSSAPVRSLHMQCIVYGIRTWQGLNQELTTFRSCSAPDLTWTPLILRPSRQRTIIDDSVLLDLLAVIQLCCDHFFFVKSLVLCGRNVISN